MEPSRKARYPELKFSRQMVAIMRKVYTALGLRREGTDGNVYARYRRNLASTRNRANSTRSSGDH